MSNAVEYTFIESENLKWDPHQHVYQTQGNREKVKSLILNEHQHGHTLTVTLRDGADEETMHKMLAPLGRFEPNSDVTPRYILRNVQPPALIAASEALSKGIDEGHGKFRAALLSEGAAAAIVAQEQERLNIVPSGARSSDDSNVTLTEVAGSKAEVKKS